MHSSSADCVRGVARLISSASRIFVNTGPLLNSKFSVRALNMLRPVTSEGSRSGVNCMREKAQSSDLASDLAMTVLPVPGTSSSSTWPRAIIAHSISSTVSLFPTMTF